MTTAAAFILIATLSGSTQTGKVSVPIAQDFPTRAECVEHLDRSLQAARRQFTGPVTLTVIAHCELRRAK